MESQPQNLEYRINPENFHPCAHCINMYGKIRFKGKNTKKVDNQNMVRFGLFCKIGSERGSDSPKEGDSLFIGKT